MTDRERLRELVETTRLPPERVATATRSIYDAVLKGSPYLDGANFTAFHPADLRRLFESYDDAFFGGLCRKAAADHQLDFRISNRMTSAGGKTFRYSMRGPTGGRSYAIAVSAVLLFQSFRDAERTVRVTGIECRDRLEALQRIFEHELIHLIEFLVWDASQCSANRFQSIASGFFGHTDHRHQLITPRENSLRQFGVRVGSRVRFEFEGVDLVGRVNRITRRATVLVEDARGPQYSDGKRYMKYYIPVAALKLVETVKEEA